VNERRDKLDRIPQIFNLHFRLRRVGILGGHVSEVRPLDIQLTKALLDSIHKLCDLFWGPDPQKCGEMLAGDYWNTFNVLESSLKLNSFEAVKKLKIVLENFTDADSLCQYLETAYVRLFVSHRDGIAAPLYESCYVGVESGQKGSLMGKPALRMKQRFESKGLAVASSINEPPDHLAIELEYLHFLLSKGREDQNEELLAEAKSLAGDIMLPWVSKLQEQIVFHLPNHAYSILISILTAVLDRVAQIKPSQNSRAM
jgi:TorA-specific chaperone